MPIYFPPISLLISTLWEFVDILLWSHVTGMPLAIEQDDTGDLSHMITLLSQGTV